MELIMKKLNIDEVEKKLAGLEGWKLKNNTIEKSFKLKDFADVMNLVNRVAEEAEKMNHHPDIYIHSYNNVAFTLSTHSEGGITQNDFDLAERIESLK
jgi:4a-hydroxytetrahydrobiopterin dehydratase